MPELKSFYFTFGCGFPLAGFVQLVMAPDERTARAGMFRYYHDRWCACYHQAEYVRDGVCRIGDEGYKVLDKVITAYDEDTIECN